MTKHFSVHVSGRVQGVFFRASTQDKARELLIRGFVRNEPNGNVYIEAEGEEANLKTFLEWCRVGPPRAKVISCVVAEGPVQGFSGFEVRR